MALRNRLLIWSNLRPGDPVTSTDGFGGVVLAVRPACDVVGRAQIHWYDGEITWIRPDMLSLAVEPICPRGRLDLSTAKTVVLREMRRA